MEDQLITFETAKLAKEKGFNNSPEKYNYSISESFYEDGELQYGEGSYGSISLYQNIYDAPTQSLLQRWLREIRGVGVFVYLDDTMSYYWEINSLHPTASYKGEHKRSLFVYSEYEEALEKGLQKALTLI